MSTHGSNFNSIIASMSELEFSLLKGGLSQNSNIVELINVFEENKKLYIQIIVVALEMTSCRTMSKKDDE